jgi:hypothetical protein
MAVTCDECGYKSNEVKSNHFFFLSFLHWKKKNILGQKAVVVCLQREDESLSKSLLLKTSIEASSK